MVDKGFNQGRVGLSFREGWRVQAEQLGTKAAPGQSKPEEGGGPSWLQQAGGRWRGESRDRAQGEAGSGLKGPPGARGSCVCGLTKVHPQLLQGTGIRLQSMSPRVVAECGLELSCHLGSPWPNGWPSVNHSALPCQMRPAAQCTEVFLRLDEHSAELAHPDGALPWARHRLVPHASVVISIGQLGNPAEM